jgi:hypothetical protein
MIWTVTGSPYRGWGPPRKPKLDDAPPTMRRSRLYFGHRCYAARPRAGDVQHGRRGCRRRPGRSGARQSAICWPMGSQTHGKLRRPSAELPISRVHASGFDLLPAARARMAWPNRDASPVSLEGSRGCAPPVGRRLGHLTNSSLSRPATIHCSGIPRIVVSRALRDPRHFRQGWWLGHERIGLPIQAVSLADYPPSRGQLGGRFANTLAPAAPIHGRLTAGAGRCGWPCGPLHTANGARATQTTTRANAIPATAT